MSVRFCLFDYLCGCVHVCFHVAGCVLLCLCVPPCVTAFKQLAERLWVCSFGWLLVCFVVDVVVLFRASLTSYLFRWMFHSWCVCVRWLGYLCVCFSYGHGACVNPSMRRCNLEELCLCPSMFISQFMSLCHNLMLCLSEDVFACVCLVVHALTR